MEFLGGEIVHEKNMWGGRRRLVFLEYLNRHICLVYDERLRESHTQYVKFITRIGRAVLIEGWVS